MVWRQVLQISDIINLLINPLIHCFHMLLKYIDGFVLYDLINYRLSVVVHVVSVMTNIRPIEWSLGILARLFVLGV